MDTYYWDGLQKEIDLVYSKIGRSFDPRLKYPWLRGALGNPNRRIWFVAENPSLLQIEKVTDPSGGDMTPEHNGGQVPAINFSESAW